MSVKWEENSSWTAHRPSTSISWHSQFVFFCLCSQAVLLGHSASVHSPTDLEPAFLASGLSHWEFRRFELYRVNPPLVRMIAAIPVITAGYRDDWSRYYDGPGSRSEFPVGDDLIKANGRRIVPLICYARWACIPFSLAGAYFAYRWAVELYGDQAGLVALSLYVFDPNLLSHGELITPDAACAALGIVSGYTFWRWLKYPTWGRAALSGIALGLAELSKLTWIFLFALWPLIWLAWRLLSLRNSIPIGQVSPDEALSDPAPKDFLPGLSALPLPVLPPASQLVAILTVAVYIMNLAYGFDGALTPLKQYTFVSRLLNGSSSSDVNGNRFQGGFAGEVPVPFPRQYVLGFDSQQRDFEDYGKPSYFRGVWRDHGWWNYYLYGLLVKTPCPTLALFLGACIKRFVSAPNPVAFRNDLVLLSPAIAVLAIASSQTEFNHHLRYVYPCLGFLIIFTSQIATSSGTEECRIWRRHPIRGWLIAVMVACSVGSALWVYPHHLSYFNLIAGGPGQGHLHFAGSNLDWGQDLCHLADWHARYGRDRPLLILADSGCDPAVLGLNGSQFSKESFLKTFRSDSGVLLVVSKNLSKISPEFLRWGGNARWRDWYEFQADFRDRLVRVPAPFNAYDVYEVRE